MANQHFAKFADIWKHLPLAEALRVDQPRRYWETHAGSGSYLLTESPERDFGLYWFLPRALKSELADSLYVELLSSEAGTDEVPVHYPGSAMFAMLTLGRNAHDYVLCDLDPHSAADLRRTAERTGLADLTRIFELDGPTVIERELSRLPSAQVASTLCFIDPFDPFGAARGAMSSIELATALSAAALEVVYRYGYDQPDDAMWPLRYFGDQTSAWCGDMLLPERDESGLIGCGVVLANGARMRSTGARNSAWRSRLCIGMRGYRPGRPGRCGFRRLSLVDKAGAALQGSTAVSDPRSRMLPWVP